MYYDFYALRDNPFRLTPNGRNVYLHPSFEQARAYLEYGLLQGEGFVVVTGPPGSGKTTLMEDLLARLPEGARVAKVVTSRLGASDLLRMVAAAFDLRPTHRDKASILDALQQDLTRSHRRGNRNLLLVDEAQDLSSDALEELRLLTNLTLEGEPLLQVLLLGQPPLRDVVRRPELSQFHQRMIASSRLQAMTEEQTVDYVCHRLRCAGWRGDPAITDAALRLLHRAAGGVPRRVNIIASRLLLYGFTEGSHDLRLADLEAVLGEMEEESVDDWEDSREELERAEAEEIEHRDDLLAAQPEEEIFATDDWDDDEGSAFQAAPEPARRTAAYDPYPDPFADPEAHDDRADTRDGDPRGKESPRSGQSTRQRSGDPFARLDRGPLPAPESIVPGRDDDSEGLWAERADSYAGGGRKRPGGHHRSQRQRAPAMFAAVLAAVAALLVVVATTPLFDHYESAAMRWFEAVSNGSALPALGPQDGQDAPMEDGGPIDNDTASPAQDGG